MIPQLVNFRNGEAVEAVENLLYVSYVRNREGALRVKPETRAQVWPKHEQYEQRFQAEQMGGLEA